LFGPVHASKLALVLRVKLMDGDGVLARGRIVLALE
jgi:hypothetical protein